MGVRLDAESWYSVTPESIAIHIAEQCQFGCQRTRKLSKSEKKARKRKEEQFPGFIHPPPVTFKCDVVLDLFCGCGGNSIPLASVFQSVVAVDINPEKLADAR